MIRKIGKALLLVLLLNLMLILPSFARENSNPGADEQFLTDKLKSVNQGVYGADIQKLQSVNEYVYSADIQKFFQKIDSSIGKKAMGTVYEYEPNDTRSNADTIQLDDYVYGTFRSSTDFDAFKITVTQPGTLKIIATSGQSGYYSKYFDCGLYSSSGSSALDWSEMIATSSGKVQYLERYVTPGTYYIVLETYDASTESHTSYIVGQQYVFKAYMEDSTVHVTGVTIDNKISTMEKGTTAQISATVYPSNATNSLKHWSSSNSSVVAGSVENGTVTLTAVGTGTARITVTTDDGGFTDYCDITVTDVIHVTGVTIDNKISTMEKGSTAQLTATVYPSNANNKYRYWSSNNSSVVAVNITSGTVNINAVETGMARITVRTDDGSYTDYCDITVTDPIIHPTAVTLNKHSVALYKGKTETLLATILPYNAGNTSVTWTSDDPSVASGTCSNDNPSVLTVTAVGVGSTYIRVMTADGEKTDACFVTVTEELIHPTSIKLNKNSTTITKGSSETLIATIYPSNVTNKTVSWVSSNRSKVTVDTNGNVTAVEAGNANITAITADGGKTDICYVTVIDTDTESYENWNGTTQTYNVEPNKVWTVKFNKQVDESSLQGNIKIVNKWTNEIVPISISVLSGAKVVKLNHTEDFQCGTTYTLYINSNCKVKDSVERLSKAIKMDFTVREIIYVVEEL